MVGRQMAGFLVLVFIDAKESQGTIHQCDEGMTHCWLIGSLVKALGIMPCSSK
jgi:hypothetical protein